MKRVRYAGENILMKKLMKYLVKHGCKYLESELRYSFDIWCDKCYFYAGGESDICYHVKNDIGDCECTVCPVNYYFKSKDFREFKEYCELMGVDLSDFKKKYLRNIVRD